jgi:hypothetical protein
MRIRIVTLAACATLAAGGLAACGGSSGNGVASKSADEIVTASGKAISHAKSVHVTGSISTRGVPLTLDLTLVNGTGGRGQISEGGLSFRLVDVGQTVYIQGSQAFWQHFGGAAAARVINGRWLKAPDTGQFASLATLTNMQKLTGALLLTHGSLAKGGTSTVNGQQVVSVTDKSKGGTLYVATTGPAYPVELKRTSGNGGQILFDKFNESVTLTPPASAISLSSLG